MANNNLSSIKGLLQNISAQSAQITGSGALGSGQNWSINLGTISLDETPKELVRKYEIYESTEDLLALSAAWYRIRNTLKDPNVVSLDPGISKLLDKQLFSKVRDEDREFAAKIRDYYSKKIMIWKLKNQPLTPYREDLNKFIHSDGTKFVERDFGLVYRLPEFYMYDTKLDDIFMDRNKSIQKNIRSKESKKLTFIDKTLVDRKSSIKRNEYWFTDNQNNISVVILGRDNPLIDIWEQMIQHPVDLEGHYFVKRKDDKDYFQLEKFQFKTI